MIYLLLFLVFIGAMLLYFKIADKYNIIDHPNERSSHSAITIRGGGIIFILAALILLVWHFNEFYLVLAGAIAIGAISFADDIYTLPNKLRLAIHGIAVSLMFLSLHVYSSYSLLGVALLYILAIGIINAYNFMDGINGITGSYSLVTFAGLQYVNIRHNSFISPEMIWVPMLACIAFLIFNFRKKARCFAGDVGSVTIAFWITFLLLKLIFITNNWLYILFLAVYGVDAVLTIIHRLMLKQNIFKAHRLHFYQLLSNEYKMPHLIVSSIYAIVQLAVIILIITNENLNPLTIVAIVILPLMLSYLIIKPYLMKLRIIQ
ncbi:glycosyltransferase family 4 protein [Mucilaginibacter rigui]|uniref:Glycosyltransferase family 4 protein n=2 Tax=Mucilaginibacter rigui TaxID=534635 RepID=A0ABR7X7Z9_9SPHI|nr:glycosyltransferase family 4 protein [Mucilaginibacter rigui]